MSLTLASPDLKLDAFLWENTKCDCVAIVETPKHVFYGQNTFVLKKTPQNIPTVDLNPQS